MNKKNNKSQKAAIHKYSRRQAFSTAAKGFVGINVGMGIGSFIGSLTPEQMIFKRIFELVTIKDPQVFAAALEKPDTNFFQITLADKVTSALMFKAEGDITGNQLNGLDLSGASFEGRSIAGKATETKMWRGIPLTALWGDILEDMPQNFNVAFLPQASSLVGGHNLNTANLGPTGGANHIIDTAQQSGVLGFTGFAFRAAANNTANAATAPGGIPLTTYDSVLSLRSTLNRAFRSLLDPDSFAAKFRTSLDRMALKNDQTFKQMRALRDSIEPTLAPLLVAANEGDAITQQIAAAEAMVKTGLSSNLMLSVVTADTNAGGSLAASGGSQNLNPGQAHAAVARMLTTISQKMPNSVVTMVSDGGRSNSNGDAARMTSFVAGPSDLVKQGVFGKIPDINGMGQDGDSQTNGDDIKMSNGTNTKVVEQRHFLSAAVHAAKGIETGVEYPSEILVKKKA